MALLGENGLAKDLGFPIDSSLFFFFFTLHFPIKISNLAALFLVKILQGGRRGERRDCYFASCTGQLQGWLFIGEDRLDPLQSQILHLL